MQIATEAKTLYGLVNGDAADLSALTRTQKDNLVAALNEVVNEATARAALLIGTASATSSTATTSKIRLLIQHAVSNLVSSSPSTLDTLKELANAVGDDLNFAAPISTVLGNRLRIHSTQTLTSAQQN